MISIANGSVRIQTSAEAQPATPPWLGEVALAASHLQKQGILNKICERVRFARRRFGHYDVLDFLAVLFGYAISGERTLEAFYETIHPFASAFMALFGRASLPAASTLSRFLAALPAEPVEALRTLFLEDLLARRLSPEELATGLWDRQGNRWLVFDVDGTREAARQRALPQTPDRPPPQRRLRPLCAPGYTGRETREKLCGRAQPSCRCIRISGWPASATLALGSIVKNCAGQKPLSRRMSRPTAFPQNGRCCASMANMEQERSSPMWPTLRMLRAAKTTGCSTSRLACTCLLINNSSARDAWNLPRALRLSRPAPGREWSFRSCHCGDSPRSNEGEKETTGRAHPGRSGL